MRTKEDPKDLSAESGKKYLGKDVLPKWLTSMCGGLLECMGSDEDKGKALATHAGTECEGPKGPQQKLGDVP